MISSAGIFRILLAMPLLLVLWQGAAAQSDASESQPSKRMPPLVQTDELCLKTGNPVMDEIKIRACLKQQQKEYRELLDHGEEAAKLSSELEKNFDKTALLAAEDQKKLERLEKLFKKIRGSLGGEEDDPSADEERPMSLKAAIDILKEKAVSLLNELKKTTRYSISAVAIQSSNIMIRLVKYIRFSRN